MVSTLPYASRVHNLPYGTTGTYGHIPSYGQTIPILPYDPMARNPVPTPSSIPASSPASTPSSMPGAASLAEELVAANRNHSTPTSASSYSGPNMQDIRADQAVADLADRVLKSVLERAPFLNPRGAAIPGGGGAGPEGGGAPHPGLGQHSQYSGAGGSNMPVNVNTSTMSRPNTATLISAHNFAAENTVNYADKINANNINLPNFVYGYTRQLLAVMQGRTQPMAAQEFTARVQHLANVMQVVIINSTLAEHNDKSWQIGRDYTNRVEADIRDGAKAWHFLTPNIQADCYVFAKDHQASTQANKTTRVDKGGEKSDKFEVKKDRDAKANMICRDYNTKANTGENCSWELDENNTGKRCNRLHDCSTCFKSGAHRAHRALTCSAPKGAPFQPPGSGP